MRISEWSSDVCSSDLAIEQRWTHQLKRQGRSADVELVAEFARIESSIGELMRLEVNDILPLEITPAIKAHVGGVPVMECTYGTFNGRYALRVKKVLASSETDIT